MAESNTEPTKKHYGVVALIPCYNMRRYIRTAVLGLLNQTRVPDLIVVLDDCSTDGFEEEIDDLLKAHDNLIIHHNPHNLKVSGCRNEGIKKYPADFYFLNDADDISLPNRVELSLNFLQEHPNCGIVGGFVEYIDSKGKVFGKGTQIDCLTEEDANRYRNSLKPLGLFTSTVCIRGEVLRNHQLLFDTNLIAAEDMDLWNRVLETGWDVLSIPLYLSQYRFHGGSICTSRMIFCKTCSMYVKENLKRRRLNMSPLSYEEFCNEKHKESWWTRLKYLYPIYAEHFYRTGGFYLVEGKFLRGGTMLLTALLMTPHRIRRLICQRLGKRL